MVKEQLGMINARFPSVTVEDFVIMPDHIHAVIFIHKNAGGASPSPTAILDAEAKKSRLVNAITANAK